MHCTPSDIVKDDKPKQFLKAYLLIMVKSEGIVRSVSESRGKKIDTASVEDYKDRKEVAYDKLAENLRKSLDMEYIYKVLGLNK